MDIRVVPIRDFVFVYNGSSDILEGKRTGRWVWFSRDADAGGSTARQAVRQNAVSEAKYMRSGAGPVSFYLDADDDDAHRRIIGWMLERGLFPKDAEGRLREQRFIPAPGSTGLREILLSEWVDLATGELR